MILVPLHMITEISAAPFKGNNAAIRCQGHRSRETIVFINADQVELITDPANFRGRDNVLRRCAGEPLLFQTGIERLESIGTESKGRRLRE